MGWLELYNSRRLHQTLGNVSPMVFEWGWFVTWQQDKKAA